MALLLSVWLPCGGGAFKTCEDVHLSIWSITTDIGVEAGSPCIDNVLSHFAAVVKRRVSGTFQAYLRLLPRCVHVRYWHHFWAGVIKCAIEADDWWPSTLQRSETFAHFPLQNNQERTNRNNHGGPRTDNNNATCA